MVRDDRSWQLVYRTGFTKDEDLGGGWEDTLRETDILMEGFGTLHFIHRAIISNILSHGTLIKIITALYQWMIYMTFFYRMPGI